MNWTGRKRQCSESEVIWDEWPFAFVCSEVLYKDLWTEVSQPLYAFHVPSTSISPEFFSNRGIKEWIVG